MIEKIKKIYPYVLIITLFIISVVGYSAEKKGAPLRILIKTKGGSVIFTHKNHQTDYEPKCVACHHNIAEENNKKKEWRCTSCHRKGGDLDSMCSDRPIHKQCIGGKCLDCHTEMGMDAKNCGLCHH